MWYLGLRLVSPINAVPWLVTTFVMISDTDTCVECGSMRVVMYRFVLLRLSIPGCPEIVSKDLRVTKEIWFENSGPSLIPFRFCKFSNWQTQCKIWVVDVPIMWRINVKFEKTSKLKSLYHLKNSNKISYEPWLKPIYYWPLSHGSNPHIIGLWAMAQTPIFLAFEPWLKPPYF